MSSFAIISCAILLFSKNVYSLLPVNAYHLQKGRSVSLLRSTTSSDSLQLTPSDDDHPFLQQQQEEEEDIKSSALKHQLQYQKLTSYAFHWENLLLEEYRENAMEMKHRRKTWTRSRLEASGMSIFDASAEPDSEMYGEKIVRIIKFDENANFRGKFAKGEVLVLTPEAAFRGKDPYPREGIVIDVGKNWLTLGVGNSWPVGLFEMRKHAGKYLVRIDRTAPVAPLKAQQIALEKLRKGQAGDAANILALMFDKEDELPSQHQHNYVELSKDVPSNFDSHNLEEQIAAALEMAISSTSLEPNQSQKEAVTYALSRKIGLIRGPPGTGKTRVASLLISTAMKMKLKVQKGESEEEAKHPRILAVTHSNGAADVLVQALLQMNVPAVRSGRPASVSPAVQHRTIAALAESNPEVIRLRQEANDAALDSQTRQSSAYDAKGFANEMQQTIAKTAPVIVTSCIGAQQLLSSIGDDKDDGSIFPIVVLDEAAQTTEPALICALAAAKARQIILVGDTQQLPPTVGTENSELRNAIGVSPMERLLKNGLEEFTLREQYRMPAALLQHPNQYFYNGLVQCAEVGDSVNLSPPTGFPWPNPNEPLAFLAVGNDSELAHNFGSRSNPLEVKVIMDIIKQVLASGDVSADKIAVITPYSKQVQLFQSELNNANYLYGSKTPEVKVGTVDSFQGQETDLVIFSAVRSNLLKELGFLRDQRRLNVAITRAKRGLIVVGDPTVLKTCRHWRALLDSCSARGCTLTELDYNVSNAVKADEKKRNLSKLEVDYDDEFFGLF